MDQFTLSGEQQYCREPQNHLLKASFFPKNHLVLEA